jgi:hypothetical protein
MDALQEDMSRERPPTVQITVRIPRELAERVDQLVTQLSRPGTEATLTTVIRAAIDRGVTSLEQEVGGKTHAAKKGGPR